MASSESAPVAKGPVSQPNRSLPAIDAALFDDVSIALDVRLGHAKLTIGQIHALQPGSVVPLDVKLDQLATVHFKDVLIARGEIVAVNDSFGLRIVEIAPVKKP
jgi:flagellar motor switch protein FliN/FliY